MRIKQIANMVDKCNIVADIGTDHGYVTEIILKRKICQKVIATDLNLGPLENAKKYLTLTGLNDRVDFRQGSGLEVLQPGEADTVIIAGMGGMLINKILHDAPNITEKVNKFILQPMTAVNKVRKYLFENGFKIESESIVKEYHHYYHILKVVHGIEHIDDDIYFEISQYLLRKKDKLVAEYLNKQIDTNKKILNKIDNSKKKELIEKKIMLQSKIKKYKELKQIYDIE